ncbi:MAG TPA: GNAT family N-acetyltransferase [Acidimicrobiales bacterium]|nr:GNAT family N-acetyltransferase [Acidimicrobiales bacterium]
MIRAMDPGDLDEVLELNNTAVPAVNELDDTSLAELVAMSDFARVAEHEGRVGALLITLTGPGHGYPSENYAWFCERETDFIYVDRIVVHPALHGRGIGRRFYDSLVAHARGRTSRIFAEVNTRPRNHRSLDFHRRYGFERVGERESEGGTKSVVMLELALPRPGNARP